MNGLLKNLKFDSNGLICSIVQDYKTNQVLMVAYMNRQALELTLKTRLMHFYSRSRKKLWKKGERSRHLQKVKQVLFDCDGDCLLFKVEQKGAACHEGFYSCFYRSINPKSKKVKKIAKLTFDPKGVYRQD